MLLLQSPLHQQEPLWRDIHKKHNVATSTANPKYTGRLDVKSVLTCTGAAQSSLQTKNYLMCNLVERCIGGIPASSIILSKLGSSTGTSASGSHPSRRLLTGVLFVATSSSNPCVPQTYLNICIVNHSTTWCAMRHVIFCLHP